MPDGRDVIFAASGDLRNFSGHKQGEPGYDSLVTRIHDVTLKAGIKLGGPQTWKGRPGFTFFQAPPETMLIEAGAQLNLGITPAAGGRGHTVVQVGAGRDAATKTRRAVTARMPIAAPTCTLTGRNSNLTRCSPGVRRIA